MKSLKLLENYYSNDVYPFNDNICKSIEQASNTCKNTSNVVFKPLGPRGKIGIPYKYYECKKPNKISIMKQSKIVKPYLNKLRYQNVCSTMSLCKLENDLKYCGIDEFTNESIIGLSIEDYVKKYKFCTKSYVKQYNAYTCNTLGYNHMELCDLGDMSSRIKTNKKLLLDFTSNKPHVLAHCLLQISKILHFLQVRCHYTHGDLKAGNVFIKNEPTLTKLGKQSIKSPITFKLADYGKNCISLGKYRLFNDHIIRKIIPQLKVNQNSRTFVLNKFTYVPRYYRSQLLFAYLRHIGLPFFADLDLYIFIASLLLNDEYGSDLLNFPLIFHKTLWVSSQVEMIGTHVQNIKASVPKNRIKSVTSAMHFLTKKLPNGEYIVMKKQIANKLNRVIFHLIKNNKFV